MLNQDVVRRLSIVATESGLTSVNTKLRDTNRLYDQGAVSAGRYATATEQADRRMQALLRQRDRYVTSMNAGGLGGVGRTAGSDVGAFAMRNVAPIVAGVGAVAAAYAALNKVWSTGAELLEKYANAHRLVDPDDLASSMKNLAKYQQDTISASQVQRATELGTRLEEAKFTIDQFLKVHLDLVDPALKLQAAWVTVVESIAAATRQLDKFIEKIPSMPGAGAVGGALLGAVPGGGLLTLGSRAVNALAGPEPKAVTETEALAAAYGKLGAALEVMYVSRGDAPDKMVTFAGRYVDAIKQLEDANKKVAETNKKVADSTTEVRTAFDRALDAASKRAAVQEAEAKAVGLGAGALAKFRVEAELTEAALRSGLDPASADVAAKIKAAGDRAEEAANKLKELQALQSAFDSFWQSFADGVLSGKDAMDALTGAASALVKQLASDTIKRFQQDGSFFPKSGPGLMSLQGGVGMVSAGLSGYQSGSPLTGALGGALAGASFGPAGMAAGAVIGGVSGWFGQRAQEKQAAEQAALEAQRKEDDTRRTRRAVEEQYDLRRRLGRLDETKQADALAAFDLRAENEILQAKRTPGNLKQDQLLLIEKTLAEERLKIIEDFAKRAMEIERSYEDRIFNATNDASTLEGSLAAFDRAALREREQAIEAGSIAIEKLEEALAAERLQIIQTYNERIIEDTRVAEEQRRAALLQTTQQVLQYIQQLQTGSESPLSPGARLAAAQSSYNLTRNQALSGDMEAYAQFTQAAETLRQAAQAMYGSSAGYQAVFDQIVSDGLGLTGPIASTDPVLAKLQEVVAAVNTQGSVTVARLDTNNNLAWTGNTIAQNTTNAVGTNNSLVATGNTIATDQINWASYQASFLSAIKGLGDIQRQIGNAAATQAAHIGSQTVFKLTQINRALDNQASGSSSSWSWLGFEAGGVVGNGAYGRDSVMARYAGGGNIMLAGGEGVLTAGATAAIGGRAAIDAINRTGMMPANDNGGVVAELRALRGQVAALMAKNNDLVAALIAQNRDWQENDDRKGKRMAGKAGRAA